MEEWESLCDRCGMCCLEKTEVEDAPEMLYSHVACRLFDSENCCCLSYKNRRNEVLECIKLTPEIVKEAKFLPPSCAYRRLSEGKELPHWHPLITGNPNSTHAAGVSVKGKAISERNVKLEDLDHLLDSYFQTPK